MEMFQSYTDMAERNVRFGEVFKPLLYCCRYK